MADRVHQHDGASGPELRLHDCNPWSDEHQDSNYAEPLPIHLHI